MSSTMGSTMDSTSYHGGYDAPELAPPSPQSDKMVSHRQPSPQSDKMVYNHSVYPVHQVHQGYQHPGHQLYVQGYAPPPEPSPSLAGFKPPPIDPKPTPTICGLARSTFFALAVVAFLVIAGAVGGGIGGSMAVQYVLMIGIHPWCCEVLNLTRAPDEQTQSHAQQQRPRGLQHLKQLQRRVRRPVQEPP